MSAEIMVRLWHYRDEMPDYPYHFAEWVDIRNRQFSSEIQEPDGSRSCPDGALLISDQQKKLVASVPLWAAELALPDIVDILWPGLRAFATFGASHEAVDA